MEAQDISMIVYELVRVKEDRLAMIYEDQLSHTYQQLEIQKEKYKHLKAVIVNQKELYNKLAEQVSKLGDKKSSGSSSTSHHKRERDRDETQLKSTNKGPKTKFFKSASSEESAERADINIALGSMPPPTPNHTKRPSPTLLEPNLLQNRENILSSIQTQSESMSAIFKEPNDINKTNSNTNANADANADANDASDTGLNNKHVSLSSRPALKVIASSNRRNPPSPPSPLPIAPIIVNTTNNNNNTNSNNNNDSTNPSAHYTLNSSKKPTVPILPPTISSSSISHSSSSSSSRPKAPYVEVIRNRSERAALPGFTCTECEAFYRAMEEQGIVTESNRKTFLQCCSRHKARWTPPSTPEGFWDMSLNTPQEWKK